jgi:hypothetical protein
MLKPVLPLEEFLGLILKDGEKISNPETIFAKYRRLRISTGGRRRPN